MDELREKLGFEKLGEDWCDTQLQEDFCSTYDWPESWSYDDSLLGLERHMRSLHSFISSRGDKVWDQVVLSDVTKLQCITNIVLESCIQGEGTPLTALLCGACYVELSATKGSSARGVFHNLLLGKVMEVLKVQDEPSCWEGILAVHQALCHLMESEVKLPDQSSWLIIKSALASVNNNCSHKKASNKSFDEIFDCLLRVRSVFKFFVKEASVYQVQGKSYVADRCTTLICKFSLENIEHKMVLDHLVNLIQNLCVQISERTEKRRQVESHILKLLSTLPGERMTGLLDWLSQTLSFSTKVVHRMFAIELCFQLSYSDTMKDKEDLLAQAFQSVIKGLSDKAPTVRAKSAMVLSDILKKSDEHHRKLLEEHVIDPDPRKNVLRTVELLCWDDKSSVRKAICQLILVMLLKIRLKSSWLKMIYRLCLDVAVSVRKQAISSVCQILDANRSNELVQRQWLETVLPAINDNENSVKDFCLQQLRALLEGLCDEESSWDMLHLIASPKSADLQKYFDFGIKNLENFHLSDRTKSHLIESLDSGEVTLPALLVISKTINQFDEISTNKLWNLFNENKGKGTNESYQTMCFALTCIRSIKQIEESEALQIANFMLDEMQKFCHPFQVTKELIATLSKLLHGNTKLKTLCEQVISKISLVLHNLCMRETTQDVISSLKLCCYIFTLGEVAMASSVKLTSYVIIALKELIIDDEDHSYATAVRAMAVITLGKVSLVDEVVAKDSVMLLSKKLVEDTSCEMRNNILMVLGDFIVRFPTLTAEYLYCITDCLQDKHMVVRRQAIIVLTKLLQEDYMKWRSGVVMKFISNLVCEEPGIRSLVQLCLSNILLVRFPKTYFEFFIEVVFFCNGHLNQLSCSAEPNLASYAMPGKENMAKREMIYSAMLQNLSDQQKLEVTARICKELLTMFTSEDDKPIDLALVPLLQDGLWILCCPTLKLSSLKKRAGSDFDDDDTNVGIIEAQTKAISNIVKQNFVQNCMPIIIQLRQKLRRLKSPLQQDMTKFIVSFMSNYRTEIEVFIGADKQFLAEVEYDIEEHQKAISEAGDATAASIPAPKRISEGFMTPAFLRICQTPSLSRSRGNISFATPAATLKMFTAPTPYSMSRSLAYTQQLVQDPVKEQHRNILKKNLMNELAAAAACSPVCLDDKTFTPTQGTSCQPDMLPELGASPEGHNPSIRIVNSPSPARAAVASMEDHNPSIRIVNSPSPARAAVASPYRIHTVGKLKEEPASPIHPTTIKRKAAKNLYNPAASTDLKNVSSLSAGSVTLNKSKHDVLLTGSAGVVKIVKSRTGTVATEAQPSSGDGQLSQPKEQKPFLLGQIIKARLKEQRRRKADKTELKPKVDILDNTESKAHSSTSRKLSSSKAAACSSQESSSEDTGDEGNKDKTQTSIPVVSKPGKTQKQPSKRTRMMLKMLQARSNEATVEPAISKSDVPQNADAAHEETEDLAVRKDCSNAAASVQVDQSEKCDPSVTVVQLKPVQSKHGTEDTDNSLEGEKLETVGSGSPAVPVRTRNPSKRAQKMMKMFQKRSSSPSTSLEVEVVSNKSDNENIPPDGQNLAQQDRSNQFEGLNHPSKENSQEERCDLTKPVIPPTRMSKRKMDKILAQFQPKTKTQANKIIDKPENILLANQVLRKRKNPNSSGGHRVLQEDDMPRPKRRSLENIMLGDVTFDKNDPTLVSSTPAVEKTRRASLRLMQKEDSSFSEADPGIVASTPFAAPPMRRAASTPFAGPPQHRAVSSTPATRQASQRLAQMSELSPIVEAQAISRQRGERDRSR